MTFRYWSLIFIAGIAFGGSFFFNEILLREVGPMTVSFGRVLLGAIGCWAIVFAFGKPVNLTWLLVGQAFVLGIFQFALPFAAYPLSQEYVTSGVAGTLNALTPLTVVVVSHFWRGGERATPAKSIGVVFGFLGIVILALPALRSGGTSEFWAIMVGLVAPLCYGISLNYMRRFKGVDTTALAAMSLTGAAVFMAPLALGTEGVPVITKVETWVSFFGIGFGLTTVAFTLMYWMIPRVGATNASTVTFIAPISAMVLGVAFLGEVMLWTDLAGMIAIFGGLLMIDGRILRALPKRRPVRFA